MKMHLMAALMAALPASAAAHPHVWIESRTGLELDTEGRLVALRINWTFDEFYSAFAVEGFDKDRDGKLTAAELSELATVNMEAMKEFDYFTTVQADGKAQGFGQASDAANSFDDGLLTLSFRLKLATPLDPRAKTLRIASFDPSFYVYIEPAEKDPLTRPASVAGCNVALVPPKSIPDMTTLPEAAFDPAAQGDGPSIGELNATWVELTCPK